MNSARVLIVDDEPQIRRVLRARLCAHGYEVHEARSGEEALECLRGGRLDLVLLDIHMAGMSGVETCEQIRATSEVAIIMLTVSDDEESKVAALDAGADDYVTKPFGMPELLARVRANLRRVPTSHDANSEPMHLGDLCIHLAQRRVLVNGRPVRLTPKEFDLLHYFVVNPDIPLSHTKLLQAVWGPDYGDQVHYLRVFINQLRKKIEPEPSRPRYILTEPWLGYRLAGMIKP